MGRLTGGELPGRFGNVQYSKLIDEECNINGNTSGGEDGVVMPGYMSFSCRQCGHLQIIEGSELEMILGKSLKMAFRSAKKDANASETNVHASYENPDVLSKNNIPMTDFSNYNKPFQESADSSSIGIPMVTPRSTLSSEDSNSPTQLNQFKRIVDKPSLIKRIGKGLAIHTSDEEGYPLVSEGGSSIPGSQTNISLLNEVTTMRIGDLKQEAVKQLNNDQLKSSISEHYGECHSSEAKRVSNVNSEIFHRKEGNLKMAPWYQEGIPREIALEILSQEPIGSFMVRRSTTKLGCFALSVRVPRSFQPRGIAHYLIMRTPKGYRIKGFTKDFSSLASLIAHHSVMPELLPCPLSLSRYHPVCVISDCRRDFADIEPEPND